MPEQLIAIDGTTFALSDRDGDISGGVQGLFARDARYLSRWQLLLAGKRPRLLTAHHVDSFSNLCFLSNGEAATLPPNSVSIMRRRVVGDGMEEEFELTNHEDHALAFDLRLLVEADFLDMFEVKAREFVEAEDQVFAGLGERLVARRTGTGSAPALSFSHHDGEYTGQVDITADPAPDVVDDTGLTWHLTVDSHGARRIALRVTLALQGDRLSPSHTLDDFGVSIANPAAGIDVRDLVVPQLQTSWDRLYHSYRRSILDLTALLIHDSSLNVSLPAAGLPWFMTIFGRDTLITSFQVLPGGTGLAWGALAALAQLQASEDIPHQDAEPGRIVHELRQGPVALNGHDFPYYGSIDAPLLFLILLSETYRWSGDDARAQAMRPAAEAVLGWMEEYADLDGDGFIEYQRRSPRGLESQSWKDSWDSMRFHDGSIARSPIATCEVQGYAFDALRRTAELARGPWADPGLAESLDARAAAMYERFNDRFWTDARGGFYYLALDRDKRPVDSVTSNLGHLLWSGIVPVERALSLARQLVGPGLFSGWGIRTMSTEDLGFNPISYHCGTVWPHDNSIAVAGLHRYGFHEEANLVMKTVLDAAQSFVDSRLPEAFAGYARDVAPFPVEYPTAASPQAWAAGAPILMLRAALGAKPDLATRTVSIDPHLPVFVHRLELNGCLAFGRLFDIVVNEGEGSISERSESDLT